MIFSLKNENTEGVFLKYGDKIGSERKKGFDDPFLDVTVPNQSPIRQF